MGVNFFDQRANCTNFKLVVGWIIRLSHKFVLEADNWGAEIESRNTEVVKERRYGKRVFPPQLQYNTMQICIAPLVASESDALGDSV